MPQVQVVPNIYSTAPMFFQGQVVPQVTITPLVMVDQKMLSGSESDVRQYLGELIYPFIEAVHKE
jgi:hypothetical protein